MKLLNSLFDLTKFEKTLWLLSLIIVSISFLLAPDKDYLTLCASLIGVSALIFVAKGYVAGQILTIIFALFYGIISFYFRYYGEMITYLCMTAPIALISTITWLKYPYKDSSEVTVAKLSKKRLVFMIISAVIITSAFYFILKYFNNANLLFSTISITTSYVASFLTACRSPYYALAYAANDIVLIILWTLAAISSISYLPMIICFVMFFINDIYGYINWKRMQKRQSA